MYLYSHAYTHPNILSVNKTSLALEYRAILSKINCVYLIARLGAAGSGATSQLQDSRSNPELRVLSVQISVHVPPVSIWVFSGFSGFLALPKNMLVWVMLNFP